MDFCVQYIGQCRIIVRASTTTPPPPPLKKSGLRVLVLHMRHFTCTSMRHDFKLKISYPGGDWQNTRVRWAGALREQNDSVRVFCPNFCTAPSPKMLHLHKISRHLFCTAPNFCINSFTFNHTYLKLNYIYHTYFKIIFI